MQTISLILRLDHLPELLEAVHARSLIVETDLSASKEQKATASDLERRVELLHDAVTLEQAAKDARKRIMKSYTDTDKGDTWAGNRPVLLSKKLIYKRNYGR